MDGVSRIPWRIGIQQRVLPTYRAPFFAALARVCEGGLSLFAGQPRPQEAIESASEIEGAALIPARNVHFFGGPFYLCWQSGWARWLQTWQPQVLVVEANPRYLSTPWGVRWMRRHGGVVIGWGLGAPEGSRLPLLSGLRRVWRQRFLAQFDTLIAYSRRGAADYAALGFDPARIVVAPNAATPRPTWPPPQRPPIYPEGRPTVLFVGRLQTRKRVDLLLHACAALPTALQPRLRIVGDGPARPALEALAQTIYPSTEFLGAIHGAALRPIFEQADLFVLPGTGGLAIQQAMAYALPVIVAAGDGTQTDLVRPTNGWHVPPGNLTALTATLAEALADPARLRCMGAESFRIVREEINLETMVGAFVRAICLAWEYRRGGQPCT
ncbi:MAG: glycosyltransferase family 4 protein [Thermanaerothrix sp.]|nr:glycosyltransferase family 4 protein [Thermanaerothrix sp.]